MDVSTGRSQLILTSTDYKFRVPNAAAKSVAGISLLFMIGAQKRSFDVLFLCPHFMAGLCRSAYARWFSNPSKANLVQSAALLISLNGGGSQSLLEIIMSNNLIPIASRLIKGCPTKTVQARKLYEFLEVGRDYSTWIKGRIEEYGFVENEDFCLIKKSNKNTSPQNGGKLGRPTIDHFLTLDTAKELAMVERNEKGREARRYFIECEKQLQSVQDSVKAQEPEKPQQSQVPQPILPEEMQKLFDERLAMHTGVAFNQIKERLMASAVEALKRNPDSALELFDQWTSSKQVIFITANHIRWIKGSFDVFDQAKTKFWGDIEKLCA